MLIIRNPTDLPRIANPAIRRLVALRFQQLAPSATPATPCEFIVVEGGEAVSEIEQATGYPILTGLFDDLPFDHPDYVPPTEFIERHIHDNAIIFELFIVASDSGAGAAIFVPDEDGVDEQLLAVARAWATPAVSTP